jgi:hypothetical protein
LLEIFFGSLFHSPCFNAFCDYAFKGFRVIPLVMPPYSIQDHVLGHMPALEFSPIKTPYDLALLSM